MDLPFPLSAAVLHLLFIFLDYSITEHFQSYLKAVYTGPGGNPALWVRTQGISFSVLMASLALNRCM